MVEGDLLDLPLPRLLSALASEGSTAVLRVQRGSDQGALYFAEGALVHALAGTTAGDEAVFALLGWSDGRFRLMREAARQPRTITHPIADFLISPKAAAPAAGTTSSTTAADGAADQTLLDELLSLLTRLEQDRARIADARMQDGGVSVLVTVTAVVNSLIAFVTARCTDPNLLPSRQLQRLAETQPYTQLLGEDQERITVGTAAAVLKGWKGPAEDRRRMLQDLCRALIDVLATYGNTASTFFHRSREREEWRATFDLFVEDLRAAIQQIA
jgi:hypothetical protein